LFIPPLSPGRKAGFFFVQKCVGDAIIFSALHIKMLRNMAAAFFAQNKMAGTLPGHFLALMGR